MQVELSEDKSKATIGGGLGKLYLLMKEKIKHAEEAAAANDVVSVHAANNLLIGMAIDASHVSHFGVAVKQINETVEAGEAAKPPNSEVD